MNQYQIEIVIKLKSCESKYKYNRIMKFVSVSSPTNETIADILHRAIKAIWTIYSSSNQMI